MNQTMMFSVPGMSCEHCRAAIRKEVGTLQGVETIDVDLATKLVRISGTELREHELIAAIDDAGYDAERS
jgi:copper chaperone